MINAFDDKIKSIYIVSNNICDGPVPSPDEEIEQRLCINKDGSVEFHGYYYGVTSGPYVESRNETFYIDEIPTQKIFDTLTGYFSSSETSIECSNIGSWRIVFTDIFGQKFEWEGTNRYEMEYDGINISDLLRNTLFIQNLFAFDGNSKPLIMDKLSFEYYKVSKLNPSPSLEFDYYKETLILDRISSSIEIIEGMSNGYKVSRKYEIDQVGKLLDSFSDIKFFSHIEGNPEDSVEASDYIKSYVAKIYYRYHSKRVVTGSFDKRGLPSDYEKFIDDVYDTVMMYSNADMFNHNIFRKIKRRKDEYIFCSVKFHDIDKTYYYLTDDDTISIGDFVVIPVGLENKVNVVEVLNVEYFNEKNAPYPVDKIKKITRKCNESDYILD